MLAQLAARLRQRQAGQAGHADGEGDEEGGAIVVDDNCAVGHRIASLALLPLPYADGCSIDYVSISGVFKLRRENPWS